MNQSNTKSIKASVIREYAVPQFILMGELLHRLKRVWRNQAEQSTHLKKKNRGCSGEKMFPLCTFVL